MASHGLIEHSTVGSEFSAEKVPASRAQFALSGAESCSCRESAGPVTIHRHGLIVE